MEILKAISYVVWIVLGIMSICSIGWSFVFYRSMMNEVTKNNEEE